MKHERMRHLRPGSVAARLLEEIAETTDDCLTMGYNPSGVIRFGLEGYKQIRNAKEKRQRTQALQRLKKLKLIEEKKVADRYQNNITTTGVKELLRCYLHECDLLKDGQTSVVVFDIPESQRRFRHEIRELLKKIGFLQIQKSVWISPFDICETLMMMLGNTKRKWIRCFVANEIR